MLLEQEGYLVDTAAEGKEAITKSNNNFYNLAIVDWRLPDIEGTKLLGKLRQTTPKMRKIMLTGFPSMENAIDSVNADADAFFQKPVNANVLLNKIEELLKQQEEAREFNETKMVSFIQTRAMKLTQQKGNKENSDNVPEWHDKPPK
jgi:DNA-binding response OmpR family regulator